MSSLRGVIAVASRLAREALRTERGAVCAVHGPAGAKSPMLFPRKLLDDDWSPAFSRQPIHACKAAISGVCGVGWTWQKPQAA